MRELMAGGLASGEPESSKGGENPGGSPRVLIAADPVEAGTWLIEHWREAAQSAVAARGRCRIALSGGSTPLELYRRMVALGSLPWADCELWMVDERFVPWGHPDHNGSTIQEIFAPVLAGEGLEPQAVGAAFHQIDTSLEDAAAAARQYSAALLAGFGSLGHQGMPAFDLILLGLGGDAHTASLFPGTGAVAVEDRLALAVTPMTAPHERVSLSLPVLLGAQELVVLATGAAKAEALRRVLVERDPEAPASQLTRAGRRLLFLLDEAAAGGLGKDAGTRQ